jgi:hypothetical protein
MADAVPAGLGARGLHRIDDGAIRRERHDVPG